MRTFLSCVGNVGAAAMDIRNVPLNDLILDPNLNLRDRLDDFTVERYADSWIGCRRSPFTRSTANGWSPTDFIVMRRR